MASFVLPKKPELAIQRGVQMEAPTPVPPPSAPVPVTVTVDNSYVMHALQMQAEQIKELTARMDQSLVELADAVRKLEPGTNFTITITDWTSFGRIKTLKISKE